VRRCQVCDAVDAIQAINEAKLEGKKAGVEAAIGALQNALEPLDSLHYGREQDAINGAIDDLRELLESL
jgi:hypothetical protein